MVISGAVLIPNLKIYINDLPSGHRYISFDKEFIKSYCKIFVKNAIENKNVLKFNVEHDATRELHNICLIDAFILEKKIITELIMNHFFNFQKEL